MSAEHDHTLQDLTTYDRLAAHLREVHGYKVKPHQTFDDLRHDHHLDHGDKGKAALFEEPE